MLPLSLQRLAAFAATMLFATGAAAADITKDQCIDANTNGQVARKGGKLADARAQFLLCSDSKCPDVIRNDCSLRFAEADGALPAITFDVTGKDLGAVKVTADGKVLTDKADGTALRLEPGAHEFTFEAPGQPPITKSFTLTEGEKTRHEAIAFEAPPPPPPPPSPPPPAKPSDDGSGMRIAGLALGAAGIVGAGIGIFGGLEASSAWNDQKRDCASPTNCRDRAAALSDHSATLTWGSVSTIAFIAAVGLIASGAVIYFIAPSGDKTTGFRDPLRVEF